MNAYKIMLLWVLLLFYFKAFPQTSEFTSSHYTNHNYQFNLYSFEMGGNIKAKYFANNAYARYQSWQSKHDRKVLAVCSGAFSATWEVNSQPIGFTVDNGRVVNSTLDSDMDGLVLVMGNVIDVLDLDNLASGVSVYELDNGEKFSINPRLSSSDRVILRDFAKNNFYTLFQTQLLYSEFNKTKYTNLYYGKKAARRFLGVCSKNNKNYNVVINAPDDLYLNLSAKYAKEVLDAAYYKVHSLINLDTGDKNIFQIRENNVLVEKGDTKLEKATNLIVFYE